jgi:hypothetical protein
MNISGVRTGNFFLDASVLIARSWILKLEGSDPATNYKVL